MITSKKKVKPYLLFTALLLATFFLISCGGPTYNSAQENPYYDEKSFNKLTSHHISNEQTQLHFVEIKDTDKNPVVMIHGTPGNWESFKYILGNTQLQLNHHLISVDRLDWGQSQLNSRTSSQPSFKAQTKAIKEMIQSATSKPVILVGHSLGASLAPKVAMDYPELVAGLILISGTLNPELGKPRWYNKVAGFWVSKWFISNKLLKSNDEIYALKDGLSSMYDNWSQLKIPVAVIQGTKDKLVDPTNVLFLKKQLAHLGDKLSIIEIDKAGHFIPWEHTNKIAKAIQLVSKQGINTEEDK